jgi:hypothetical protein
VCTTISIAEPGWEVIQQTDQHGKITLFITPHAFKMQPASGNFHIIEKFPRWQVFTYSDKGKTKFESDAPNWRAPDGNVMVFAGFVDLLKSTLKPVDKQVKNGVAITHYKIVGKPILSVAGETNKWDRRELKNGELFALESISLPESVSAVIQRYYRVPACGGLPLEASYTDYEQFKTVALRTLCVNRKDIPDSTFDQPQNYRTVKANQMLLSDPVKSNVFDEFMGDK